MTVTDPNVQSDLVCTPATPVATLAPGASMNCTATHTVTQADIDAGHYFNKACVDDGAGGAARPCADVDDAGRRRTRIWRSRRWRRRRAYNAVGDVIHYTIVATNDGNVTLAT